MGELFAGWRFVPRRVLSSWRLLTVTAVGILFAAALLAAVPLYSNALSNLGLQFRLDRALGATQLNHIEIPGLFPGEAIDVARRAAVNDIFDARVGWLGPERLIEERSPRLFLDFPNSLAPTDSGGEPPTEGEPLRLPWNAFLYRLSGFSDHVTVTEGRLPGPGDGPPEVVLLDGFQQHAAVGDTITLQFAPFDDCERLPRSDDPAVAAQEVRCRPSTFVSSVVSLTVSGFVRPNDPGADRWDIYSGSFEVPDEPFLPHVDAAEASDAFGGVNLDVVYALGGKGSMPLFTTGEQLRGAVGAAIPHVPMRYSIGLIADVRALTLGDVERGIDGTRLVRRDIDQRLELLPIMRFPLGGTLIKFRNTQTFQQVPLLIILLQVVGIVLYYVAVVASMLVEREAEELSVFRSRGASTAQLVGLYLMEGFFIAVAATAVAPWLAGQAVAALGYTPTFEIMTSGSALPVTVTPSAYLLAAAGAALALLALLVPAYAVSRRAIIDAKLEQSRPPGRSLIQRYYLDFAVIGLAGLLLWQLGQRGTVFDPDAVGGWSSDPLLLVSPLVFTAAVAALVLRLYPPLLRRTVSVLLAVGGTAVALGLRRTARAPAAYARLMLLLVMAISVGTFAASYGPTVDRSQTDRVRYATGTDLRAALETAEAYGAGENIVELRTIDGVADAALAYRGDFATGGRGRVQLLAVDPQRVASMLWFRDDFADHSLADLMRRISSEVPSGGGIQLSDDTTALRVSMLATEQRKSSSVWARFRDAEGAYTNSRIGNLDFDGWQKLLVPVPQYGVRPLSFVGFRISEPRGNAIPQKGALYIDALTEVGATGQEVMRESFERDPSRFGWRIFAGSTSNETFEISDEEAIAGERSAKWSWPLGKAPGRRYLLMDDPNVPLAAIINPAAAGSLGIDAKIAAQLARDGNPVTVTVLMEGTAIPITVRAIVDMFPTLLPGLPFIVVNLEHLQELSNLIAGRRYSLPNEIWLSSDASPQAQRDLVESLRAADSPIRLVTGIRIQEAELETVRADPTLRASGSGILLAAFSAVLGLSMLGFLVSLVLGARARVVEFAVLRAIGSSRLQVLRSMVLEWGVVLAIGTAIGILLGRRLARVMLSFLNVTEDGAEVVPPFIVQTDWLTIGAGVGALTVVAVIGLVFAWVSSVRSDTTIELRLTR
ncbi:MAG: FtsX-like permease family protein [Dehalococcoidia bacterium]